MNELPVGRSKFGDHKFSQYFPLAVFAVLFILWRLCFLFFTHPQYFEGIHEELYRGTAARQFLTDASSLWSYRPDSYSGGYYVIVVVLAVFLKLFGFSMLAFKSISILWGILPLITRMIVLTYGVTAPVYGEAS